MEINLADIEPLAYCVVIKELLDSTRFLKGFCDNVLLQGSLKEIEPEIRKIKKELLNPIENKKHFYGIKTVILDLMDRVLALSNRYKNVNIALTSEVQNSLKKVMKSVTFSYDFSDLQRISEEFYRDVYLKIYRLFLEDLKVRGKL